MSHDFEAGGGDTLNEDFQKTLVSMCVVTLFSFVAIFSVLLYCCTDWLDALEDGSHEERAAVPALRSRANLSLTPSRL